MELLENFLQKKIKIPPKIFLFGTGGIGKTTVASQFPDCVFAITEDGINNIDVPSLPRFKSWQECLDGLNLILTTKHEYKTLVVDTIDGIESLCAQHVLEVEFRGQKTGKTGYNSWNQGDRATAQFMREVKEILTKINEQRGMTVLLLGHEGVTKKKNPLGEEYGIRTANLTAATWTDFFDWADIVGYLCREIKTKEDSSGKLKAKYKEAGRFIVFEGEAGLEVKTRAGYEMPPRISLNYSAIEEHLDSNSEQKIKLRMVEIRKMVKELNDKDVETKMTKFLGKAPTLIKANQARNRLQTLLNERIENVATV